MPGGWALPTQIVLGGGGRDLTGTGKLQKLQLAGLIPTQNRFFGIHTEYETEFAFSFKNGEVCSKFL